MACESAFGFEALRIRTARGSQLMSSFLKVHAHLRKRFQWSTACLWRQEAAAQVETQKNGKLISVSSYELRIRKGR